MDSKHEELLVRIDERVTAINKTLSGWEKNMVTQEEFKPVKRVVFGTVGAICLAAIGALLKLIINK